MYKNEQVKRGWNTYDTFNVSSLTHFPDGASINIGFKDYKSGAVKREFFIGDPASDSAEVLPGVRSYDGSYIEYEVRYDEIAYNVRSCVKGDELIVLVESKKRGLKAPVIFVELGIIWNNEGYVYREGDVLKVFTDNFSTDVFVRGNVVQERNIGINNPYIAIELESNIVISTGRKYSLAEAIDELQISKAHLLADSGKYRELSESHLAMKCGLAWDTVFEPQREEFCSPVSRIL